jgi:repressor LexA
MDQLTPAQTKALEYIRGVVEKAGSAPTLRELCSYMGYKAIGSAQDVVAALRKKGFLESPDKQAARALVLTEKARQFFDLGRFIDAAGDFLQIPCLGSVPAGNPLEAIEERVDTLQMSASMFKRPLPKPDTLFAVKASGVSMINAGILDGDWLVVKVQQEAEPGSIVVARVDGDATCKRLLHDVRRGWYLKPENPDFPLIYGDSEPFEVVGKVVALQRSI